MACGHNDGFVDTQVHQRTLLSSHTASTWSTDQATQLSEKSRGHTSRSKGNIFQVTGEVQTNQLAYYHHLPPSFVIIYFMFEHDNGMRVLLVQNEDRILSQACFKCSCGGISRPTWRSRSRTPHRTWAIFGERVFHRRTSWSGSFRHTLAAVMVSQIQKWLDMSWR